MNKLEKLMGGMELTSAINSPTGGLPNGYPLAFMTRKRKVNGTNATWKVFPNSRAASSITSWGSPAVHVGNKGFSIRSATCIHSFEEQTYGQELFNDLEATGGGIDELGREELTRQTADFRRRFMNTRTHALQSALTLGKIYKAGTALLPTSSGATETIDLGVPANNVGTCNGIIGVKWDQSTAVVLSDVEDLQAAAVAAGNPPLKYAFYGTGVSEALINNPAIASLIKGSERLSNGFATGVIPDLFGLTWIPVGSQFFESAAGTQTAMTSKLVTFTPDPAVGDWYELLEGSYVIPKGCAVTGDATSALENLMKTYGMFSYAGMQMNPPGIQQFAGDTFLPVFKVPSAVYCATVLT